MKTTYIVCLVLALVGALNWGLVGIFEFNLVEAIFGEEEMFSRIVYAIVGLAGLYVLATSPALYAHLGREYFNPAARRTPAH